MRKLIFIILPIFPITGLGGALYFNLIRYRLNDCYVSIAKGNFLLHGDLSFSLGTSLGPKCHGKVIESNSYGEYFCYVFFYDSQRHGQDKTFSPKGHLGAKGIYKMGKRIGVLKQWWRSGAVRRRCNYNDDGEKAGWERRWHENGKLNWEVFWINGEKDGWQRTWSDNGRLVHQEFWKNGDRDGWQCYWDKQGKFEYHDLWKNDKITRPADGPFTGLYPDGSIAVTGQYKDREMHGQWTFWFSSGQKEKVEHYLGHKRTGSHVAWNEAGDTVCIGQYLEDKKTGEWKTWYEKNKPEAVGHYVDGKKHGKWIEYYAFDGAAAIHWYDKDEKTTETEFMLKYPHEAGDTEAVARDPQVTRNE